MANRNRPIQVKFRVTPEERAMIDRRMAQAETINMAAYLRKMAIDGYVVKLDLPELRDMISLLRRTSNNFNQIARRVNSTNRVYENDIQEMKTMLEQLWQIIGSVNSGESASMDMMSMLNMDMLYFAVAVLVSMFVADDFRSGYAKNLFTVRAKKTDYVFSKLIICSIGAELMLLAYFVGTMIGGAVAGLPFTMIGFSLGNLIMCVWSKIMLAPVFVSIYLCMSVIGKQKLWLSMLLSFMVGMFLFTIASIAAPINATILNVLLCTVGSILFGIGLGAVSNTVLKKTSLV